MIQSVERALKLLNAVASCDGWVGVRELGRMTGLKAPTAQHLLKTLQSCGYLEFDPETRGYRVGLSAILLSEKTDKFRRMRDFVKPYINRMFDEFGETTVVLAMDSSNVVAIDWRQSGHMLTVAAPAGKIVEDPHVMASGRLILSYQSDQVQRAYFNRELINASPKVIGEWLDKLKAVRAAGFCELENEYDCGVVAMSAPVFDATGDMVMALGCSIPLVRAIPENRERMKNRATEIAAEMTAGLGV